MITTNICNSEKKGEGERKMSEGERERVRRKRVRVREEKKVSYFCIKTIFFSMGVEVRG